jgi:hypothetical protein
MKLLVSGCSFSSGWGFNSDTVSRNWPNQLATMLDAQLFNVGVAGYDNPGIFLNFLEKLSQEDFDVCLIQTTAIDRIVLSPNWNSPRLCSIDNISNGLISDNQYKAWYKNFILLNQCAEHWSRLIKIISIVQNLVNQGKYIRFVNGLLNWDQQLFLDPKNSEFLNKLIDIEYISDQDIAKLQDLVYNQVKQIDLNLWINPFNSLHSLQIDNISSTDDHPGLLSHDKYATLIFNYLKDNV